MYIYNYILYTCVCVCHIPMKLLVEYLLYSSPIHYSTIYDDRWNRRQATQAFGTRVSATKVELAPGTVTGLESGRIFHGKTRMGKSWDFMGFQSGL